MSLFTLFKTDMSILATDQLVFSSDDFDALCSVLDKVGELDRKIQSVDSDIEKAKNDAIENGHKQGLLKGRSIARGKISRALLSSQQAVQDSHQQLQNTSVELALEIIRRIGLSLEPDQTIVNLALASAKDLLPGEKAHLEVHPNAEEAVTKRLALLASTDVSWLLGVKTNDSIAEDECFLTTTHGELRIGLESQLRIIERQFNER